MQNTSSTKADKYGWPEPYIQFMYGIFGREIIKYTVIYGGYLQFWPTLETRLKSMPVHKLPLP